MRKIIPYILILSVLVGLFSPLSQVKAQTETNTSTSSNACTSTDSSGKALPAGCMGSCIDFGPNPVPHSSTQDDCKSPNKFYASATNSTLNTAAQQGQQDTSLLGRLDHCGLGFVTLGGSIEGCVEHITYFIFVTIPSFIMTISANIFNFVATLTISSKLYNSDFIGKIWKVVRDFSNIFFILILLYAAFQIILDLGHGGAKKIVASVILVALLVNFSLFFTKIVIDSSNIVALIFYNRIDTTNVASYDKTSDEGKTGVVEKDMAGALVSRFNVNKFFSEETIDKLYAVDPSGQPSLYILVSAMVVYGLVIYALAYAFFIAGMSFFGRMINLMMLMMISPLAFVSATVPSFKHISTIGFDSWLKKLLESSFVAAIFMFIIYIISEILAAKIFDEVSDTNNKGFISILILLFIPAILMVMLLLKGASFAKKASGEFTEKIVGFGKAAAGFVVGGAAGLAVGAATGGVAMAGRATVGRVGSALSNAAWTKRTGVFGRGAGNLGKFAASRSFDFRNAPGVEGFAKKAGLNLGVAKAIGLGPREGGFAKAKEEKVEKRRKRAEELEVGENEGLKQNLNALEREKQELLREGSHAIELIDNQIKGAKDAVEAANAALRAETAPSGTPGTAGYYAGSAGYAAAQDLSRRATAQLNNLRTMRSTVKNATGAQAPALIAAVAAARAAAVAAVGTRDEIYMSVAAEAAEAAAEVATHSAAGTGRSINQLEDIYIPQAHHAIQVENRDRKWAYADQITRFGRLWGPLGSDANREAAHKIRMEARIETKGGH